MFSFTKVKKSLFGLVVVGALMVSSVVPAFAHYFDPIDNQLETGMYEGATVQRTKAAIPMLYAPNGQTYMNMAKNEAIVTGETTQYSYRDGIAGKQGTGMVRGFVFDPNIDVMDNTCGYYIYSRVALTARNVDGTPSGQSDIPAGVQMTYPGTILKSYGDGTMVHIEGYYSGGTWVSRDCYVNTNWASGSISSYYVYFQ